MSDKNIIHVYNGYPMAPVIPPFRYIEHMDYPHEYYTEDGFMPYHYIYPDCPYHTQLHARMMHPIHRMNRLNRLYPSYPYPYIE